MERARSAQPDGPQADGDAAARASTLQPQQATLLALQRTAGNRAVATLLARAARQPVALLQRSEREDLEELAKIRDVDSGSTFGKILAEVLGVVPKIQSWKSVPTSGYVVKQNDEDVDGRRYLVAYQAANDDPPLRYGNLVHELTHAAVDQAYDREFVDYVADVSHKKRAATAEEWEAKGYAKENEYLLSYWSSPEYNDHLTGILVRLSSAADDSGLPKDQVDRIKNALMYGSRSPATEFDTVVNQSLTWMHMWGVHRTNAFFKQVEDVAEDARARRAREKSLAVAAPDLTPPAMTPVTAGGTTGKPRKPKKKRKLCYLTTACTSRRGLPDDCAELTKLRWFRDEHLRRRPGGDELVEAYYATAPAIVAAIDARADAGELYDAIYDVVAACVTAIDAGRHDDALRTYGEMVTGLEAALCRYVASDCLTSSPRLITSA
jgi:hypothetical protein